MVNISSIRGVFTNVKFGARFAEHKRASTWVAQGPKWSADPFAAGNAPAWNGETYPADFGNGLGGGNFPKNVWQLSPGVLEAWGDKYSNRDPLERQYFAGEFSLNEKNTAVYAMSNLEGEKWRWQLRPAFSAIERTRDGQCGDS